MDLCAIFSFGVFQGRSKARVNEMVPINLKELRYVHGSTGGSTGEPLKYFMSLEDLTRGIALQHRGWGYAGYHPADRMAIIGGYSLIPTKLSAFRRHVISALRNLRYYPSYIMSDEILLDYIDDLNRFSPKFLRGYPSSICTIANFIQSKNLEIEFKPKAILTTGEKLLKNQKEIIEDVFRASVFDNYGLNDGGVSAYECEMHNGMHIDMERAVLEVVDENKKQIIGKPGKILATSLYNYAMPFIRYDTGDYGILAENMCACGRQLPLIKEIVGRTVDVIEICDKKIRFPTALFGKLDIIKYQIILETENSILIRIVKGKTYCDNDEQFIRKWVKDYIGPVDTTFEYVSSIAPYKGNKHKYLIDMRHNK